MTTRAIAAIALATGLLAQGQTPTFKSRADLVQVDVIVVDKDNAPVRGLQQSEFVLRDRGKPQDIATFDEVSRDSQRARAAAALPPGVPRDVSDNQDVQSSRLVVLVFDDLHIWRDRTERAKEIGRKVLAELGPQSSMAVLFTSGDHSTNLSTDHTVLAAAIETFKATPVVAAAASRHRRAARCAPRSRNDARSSNWRSSTRPSRRRCRTSSTT